MFGFCILGTGMIAKDMGQALLQADHSVGLSVIGSRSLAAAQEFAAKYHRHGTPAVVAVG